MTLQGSHTETSMRKYIHSMRSLDFAAEKGPVILGTQNLSQFQYTRVFRRRVLFLHSLLCTHNGGECVVAGSAAKRVAQTDRAG